MNAGLDTTIIVRIISGLPEDQAERVALRLGEIISDGGVCEVSAIAVVEAYYALQKYYGMTKEEAIGHLRRLSTTPGFRFSPETSAVLQAPHLERANPGFIDRVLAAGYHSRQLVTLSCEKSFRKLPDAEVVS